jgi:hypothetical protein
MPQVASRSVVQFLIALLLALFTLSPVIGAGHGAPWLTLAISCVAVPVVDVLIGHPPGYPTMVLVALIPPRWFGLMGRRLSPARAAPCAP